jgi:recombination protein RecR
MYEGIIQDLIDELGRLPGVGPKSAQRIAFHIIQSDRVDVTRLAEVLKTVKEVLYYLWQYLRGATVQDLSRSKKR